MRTGLTIYMGMEGGLFDRRLSFLAFGFAKEPVSSLGMSHFITLTLVHRHPIWNALSLRHSVVKCLDTSKVLTGEARKTVGS